MAHIVIEPGVFLVFAKGCNGVLFIDTDTDNWWQITVLVLSTGNLSPVNFANLQIFSKTTHNQTDFFDRAMTTERHITVRLEFWPKKSFIKRS